MVESGEKFGKYTLLERLAVGGMAEIFKASVGGVDGFKKIVAIKRLHRQFSEDGDFATMLADEANLAVRLTHGNIGEVFDLGCIDGQYFIVMEFIDGLNLHELDSRARERGQRLPLEAIVYVTTRAAEALHYAHSKLGPDGKLLEIVHRDVSPQNIMLSVDGETKLVDFGIAKARMRAGHTRAGVIKGKFYYMSPEQAHGGRIDGRTDVYALGMVLYEILSGAHPFEDVGDDDLLRSVRMADFPPIHQVVDDLDPDLASIVDRALERDVDRRFQSALEVKRALDEFSDRNLGRFERMELAELVRQYRAPSRGGENGSNEVGAMGSGEYRADKHSVIFEAGEEPDREDFSQDEKTRVFTRRIEEKEEPAHRNDQRDDKEKPGGAESSRSPSSGAASDPSHRSNRADAEAGPLESVGRLDGAHGGGEPAGATTKQVHRRLLTEMGQRFEHLYRRRPHIVGAAMAGVALVLLAISAWLVVGPQTPAEDDDDWHVSIAGEESAGDDAEVENPDLRVSTTPANAGVYLDGEFRGKTPLTLQSLEVGQGYVVRFEREGYESKNLNIVAQPKMTPRVVRLEPLGGIIRVETEPEGAVVLIDGNEQGPAPVTVMGLERELTHEIEARLSDEEVQTKQLSWSDDDERSRQVRFEFEVEDEDDDEEQDSQTARSGSRASASTGSSVASAGSRRAPVHDDGAEVEDDDGQEPGLDIWQLGEGDGQGRLNVRTNADEGRIYVDGDMVKDDTVLIGHPMEAGSYEVKVYFPATGTYSEPRTVDIRGGETSTVMISP